MVHNHALTVASRTLQSMAQTSGVPTNQIHYIPNGPGIGDKTDQAAARRIELGLAERPTLLLYSRLFEFDTTRLLAVLERVKTAVPDFRLLIVGASLYDQDSARFQEQLKATGLAAHVVEVGWLEETAVPDTLGCGRCGPILDG